MRPALRCCLLVALCSLVGAGMAGVAVADVAAAGGPGSPATADEPATADLRTASVPAGDATGTATASTATESGGTIDLRQELRRTPDREGEYDAHHRYRIPTEVTELEVTLPEDATVISRSGFARKGGTTYAWDGVTSRPTLTYRLPADETVEGDGPIAGPGEYLFVDRGEWALVTRPRTGHSWRWTGGGKVRLERTTVADGEGATGDAMAFLGPHEEYRHEAHGQTFRLIVPAAAHLEEDPGEIFASLAHASDAMRVGNRDGEVFVVAAPTGEVQWGVRGLQTGGADMWVRDVERLDDVNNVWLHEYVHSRQDYETAAGARWFTEGAAVY